MPNRVRKNRVSSRSLKAQTAPNQRKPARHSPQKGDVIEFKQKEVDMMPGNWAEVGNPTPYELCTTIQTCKRLWKLNKEALTHPECNHEATEYNIKVLEKLYINLMEYLVEG